MLGLPRLVNMTDLSNSHKNVRSSTDMGTQWSSKEPRITEDESWLPAWNTITDLIESMSFVEYLINVLVSSLGMSGHNSPIDQTSYLCM